MEKLPQIPLASEVTGYDRGNNIKENENKEDEVSKSFQKKD